MSQHEVARWTLSYDIADRRRGAKVHRFMCRRGVPWQYSVFIIEASSVEMKRLLIDLRSLIAWHADDVRVYRWPATTECHQFGAAMLPRDTLVDGC